VTAEHGQEETMTRKLWAGRILGAVAVLFLIFDGAIKLTGMAPVVEAFARLGYPASLAPVIGILQLGCVALYLVPRTSVLGALLLTAFLGGATASQVRIGEPLLSHILFPSYVGALLWAGLWLRNDRLRALVPVARWASD
jgi:DoxX-like family